MSSNEADFLSNSSNETDFNDDDNYPGEYYLVNKYVVITLYLLSFFIGIPLNGYIIHRLYARGIKKSNYYRLLMAMSFIDIYIAFFYAVDYYNSGYFMVSDSYQSVILSLLNAVQTFFTLVVVIYWKTVVKVRPKVDRILYILAGCHFLSYFSILLLAAVVYFEEWNPVDVSEATYFLIYVLIIGLTSIFAFIITSAVCIYCLLVVLFADTERFSVRTLKAYKRMSLAHFIQCVLVEIDFISQTFTLGFLYTLSYILVMIYYEPNNYIKFDQLPEAVQSIFDLSVVFFTMSGLIPVMKPFIRATFIGWALRRLLNEEQRIVIIEVRTTSSIRSTTRDN